MAACRMLAMLGAVVQIGEDSVLGGAADRAGWSIWWGRTLE
jgi:hypothetical protein